MIDPGRTGRPTSGRRRPGPIGPLAVLLIILGQAAIAPAAGPVAKVDGLEGRASVTRKQARRSLALDFPLILQDVVVTAPNSRLGLLFVDNTRLTVSEDTRLVITTFLFDPRKKIRHLYLRMVTGSIKFTTSRLLGFKDKRFQLRTHTATVGVRGTSAIVLAGRTGADPAAINPPGPGIAGLAPYRIASQTPVAPGPLARAEPRGYVGPYTVVYNASQGPHPVMVALNADPTQRRTLAPGDIVWVYERVFGPVGRASQRQVRRLMGKFRLGRPSGARLNRIQAGDLPDMVLARVPGTWRLRTLIFLHRYGIIPGGLSGLIGILGSYYNYGGWVYSPLGNRWLRITPFSSTARHGR